MINIDNILNMINGGNNNLNNIILKLNIFPKLLFGRKYSKKKRAIGKSFNSFDKLIVYTNYAIRNSKYYSNYEEINNKNDFIEKIKFIDKAVVLKRFDDFFSFEFDKSNYIYGTTGGTSGKPMKLYLPKNRYSFELPVVHDIWKRKGWNYQTRGVIRNHKLNKNQIYLIKPLTKEIIFDAFRIDDSYVREVYKTLKHRKIRFIQAYPSSAYLFCRICKDLDLNIDFIDCFLTGSEPVLDIQRHFIEEVMGLKISSFYGHSEKLIIGGDCEYTNDIHFEPTYGFAELIDADGIVISKIGEIGELVGTGYNNFGMLLVRYKTGDYAEYVGEICEKCGRRGLIVRNIEGHRSQNIIYKRDNTYTTTTALNLHGDLYDTIDGLQYEQNVKGELIVKLIKNKNYSVNTHEKFLDHFQNAFGTKGSVEIQYVEKIKNGKNGKFNILISNIKS